MRKSVSALTSFLTVLMLCQIVFYYPQLPAEVASHFNAAGQPDGFMSKQNYLIFEFVLLTFALLLPWLVSWFTKAAPNSLNLPNKEFWLADERRGETMAYIENWFGWLRIGLLGLFLGINQLVVHANLTNQPLSPISWAIVGGFLVFVLSQTYLFHRRFSLVS